MGSDALNPYIQRALAGKLGRDYAVKLGGSSIAFGDWGPALAVNGLSLTSASGQPILQAPKAEVSVDPLPLLIGKLKPTSVKLYDVTLRLVLLPDGSAALSVSGAQPIPLTSLFNGTAGAAPASFGSAQAASAPARPEERAARRLARGGDRARLDGGGGPERAAIRFAENRHRPRQAGV